MVIVWRKKAFLRKLTPETHEVGESWLHDMAPEVVDWYRGIPWHHYVQSTMLEVEKFLRRIRLWFMAVDRMSEQLVREVRRVQHQAGQQALEHQEQLQAAKEEKEEEHDADEVDMDDPEQLAREEQRLIVAIAQSPKEAALYSDLAKVSMKMKNYEDAIEALTAASKLEPENTSYLRRREVAKKRQMEYNS